MHVVFSADNNKEIKIIPYIFPDVEIAREQGNEEIKTTDGVLNLIGNLGLRRLNISSFFPVHDYKWIPTGAISNGWDYVDFFEKWRAKKVPIRIVMFNRNGQNILNMPCLIDNFSYSEKRNGDISYSLDVSEYVFVNLGV